MTSINTKHPGRIPYVELIKEGRKIAFQKECLEPVEIKRKVNDQEWDLLAKKARSPYVDQDDFPQGTNVKYVVRINEEQYELEVML